MKYFSEITNKTYDTVEELLQAEKTVQLEQEATSAKNAVSERKIAAKAVEAAFLAVANIKKDHKPVRKELEASIREIQNKYQKKHMELDEEERSELDGVEEEFGKLQAVEDEAIEEAYKLLREFCEKFGPYHHSVKMGDENIFPVLMGFGQIERESNLINNLFKNFWF